MKMLTRLLTKRIHSCCKPVSPRIKTVGTLAKIERKNKKLNKLISLFLKFSNILFYNQNSNNFFKPFLRLYSGIKPSFFIFLISGILIFVPPFAKAVFFKIIFFL